MIGVLCHNHEIKIVEEFFELFKTPWEFLDSKNSYDAIISTKSEVPDIKAKLMIIYSSKPTQFDRFAGITANQVSCKDLVDRFEVHIPIYGNLADITSNNGVPILFTELHSEVIAIELTNDRNKIIRVGYDLFDEVNHLLSEGQPVEKALSATLEFHISILRDWIISAGILLIEIPPTPAGFKFFACLSHDVDFAGIRRHKFDHTMWGFIYRGLFGSLFAWLKGRVAFTKLIQNWLAIFKLPLVFAGIADDFWNHFDKYSEVDAGLSSTFFLIPYKNSSGDNLENIEQKHIKSRRAAPYDIADVKQQATNLMAQGHEIGLHGIDAWHDLDKGKLEKERIIQHTGLEQIGIRMHWLCYNRRSPFVLDEAGFDYDATLGYNDSVGIKNGTTQVFRPIGVRNLLEIPLNIQDTSLFYPKRMDLSESESKLICKKLIAATYELGGVLTISWHERSLVPERLWGDFYLWLLKEIQSTGAFLGSIRQVVEWFRQRRSISFMDVRVSEGKLLVKLSGENPSSTLPNFILRVYVPSPQGESGSINLQKNYIDVPWNGNNQLEIFLDREVY